MATNTFEDIFTRLFKHNLNSSVYTSIPAVIINVETFEEEQTVDVRPLINKTYDDAVILSLPNILAVPVVFPSAGGGLLSFPIKEGDTVLLVFSMRSLDEWLEGDGTSTTPADVRTHYLNDAIAIPGLYTKKSHLKPNTTDVEIKFLNEERTEVISSIKMNPEGELLANSKSNIVANSEEGDVTISNNQGKSLSLKQSGQVLHHSGAQITDDGDFITASGISLDNHTHIGSPTAPTGAVSNTGAPQ